MALSLIRTAWTASTLLAGLSGPAFAQSHQERLSVVANGEKVGFVDAIQTGNHVAIHYDVKNNGRGPTMDEAIDLGPDGLPVAWKLDGKATFGGDVHESFARTGTTARWSDSMGPREVPASRASLYIGQAASPWALGLYARALLKAPDGTLTTLPGGTLHIEKLGPASIGKGHYQAYAISGIDLAPAMILLDSQGALFAVLDTGGATVREGHEADVPALAELATRLTAERYATLQKRFAHNIDAPVRIRNVRVFDPIAGQLGDPVSVVFANGRISGIQPLDAPASPGEALIDGQGGTLMAGLHDMHAHVSLESAMLYIAAGVTEVRDMGNDNNFLPDLMHRIATGEVAGPRILPNGFLEGRSPYSARLGIVVDSQDKALDAVRWYAARGYWQIKIYNSMNPAWVPAIAKEAHALGMTVTGHIPAFTNADAMIGAGYDEVTHINQLMLGWVLDPQEDTRTPLRLTAMKRTATLDLQSPRVQKTIDMMVAGKIAHDPTAVTLELLMLSRDGKPSPSVAEYIDHLPIGLQRRRRQAIAPIASPADDAGYLGGFEKVKETLKLLHDRGIRLMPGTDDQTGISVHRELEIYHEAGIPIPEVLRMDTLAPEQYMGRDQELGSIERGKIADFILLPGDPTKNLSELHRIAMVVKDGTIYFPSEIYPAFGVTPFADAPKVTLPPAAPKIAGSGPSHDAMDEFLY
ncbi:amidohydrolase family protein [Sphingomonas abietis]|uniref:Amidohydrolase family protein n=1 Tax=Sphingomonas abietis TaxID=3012344 RepID=A0ABY7NGU8_9SPHN|nr:amidohydrolase family protein [Sphingomonas abietis]WBO20769.1 amidohydrolase family protein [Sphingomonas abietis]